MRVPQQRRLPDYLVNQLRRRQSMYGPRLNRNSDSRIFTRSVLSLPEIRRPALAVTDGSQL